MHIQSEPFANIKRLLEAFCASKKLIVELKAVLEPITHSSLHLELKAANDASEVMMSGWIGAIPKKNFELTLHPVPQPKKQTFRAGDFLGAAEDARTAAKQLELQAAFLEWFSTPACTDAINLDIKTLNELAASAKANAEERLRQEYVELTIESATRLIEQVEDYLANNKATSLPRIVEFDAAATRVLCMTPSWELEAVDACLYQNHGGIGFGLEDLEQQDVYKYEREQMIKVLAGHWVAKSYFK